MKRTGLLFLALIMLLSIGCGSREAASGAPEAGALPDDISIEKSIAEALNPDGSGLPAPREIKVFRKAETDGGAAVLASVLPAQSDAWALNLFLLDRDGRVREQYPDDGWHSLGISLNRVARPHEAILFGACHHGLWFRGEEAPREQEPDAVTVLFKDGTEVSISFTAENKTILLPKTGDAALENILFYQGEAEIGRLTQLNLGATGIEDFNRSGEGSVSLM